MRFVGCGMLLNEETYVEYSIRSVIDFLDELTIVEGATRHAYWNNCYGLSSDRTAEIVRQLQSEYPKKIKFYQVGFVPSKVELRSMALRMATWKPETVMMIVDFDEVWPEECLKRAYDRFSASKDKLQYIHHDLHQLRGDFDHYRDMSTGEQEHNLYNEQAEQQAMICADGTELRQGRTAERLFRWQPGMFYRGSHVCIQDSQGRFPYIDPAYKDYRIWDPDIYFLHYNYLKRFEHTFTKFCYFAQQDAGKERNDEEMVNRALSEGYINYLFTGKHPAGDWAVTPLPENIKHPPLMDRHPYRHLTEREIADPDGIWLGKEPDIDQIMEMLREASRFVGPDLTNIVPTYRKE